MSQIIPVKNGDDILPEYRGTPGGVLLEYQNLGQAAGANMRDNEFRISYAIAVGGVRTIVLIAHTDCGMARLAERREQFIRGLMDAAGWDKARAVKHFEDCAPKFGIRDEVEFVLKEAERLRAIYPRITIVPLLYRVEDDLLYQLRPTA